MKAFLESAIRRYAPDCDYLEVRVEETELTSIAFKGKHLDGLREAEERGGCVRALYKGGWGFVTFNDIENVQQRIKDAIRQARLIGAGGTQLADVPVVVADVRPQLVSDPRTIPVQHKIKIMSEYNERILNTDPRIPTSAVSYAEAKRVVIFCNSAGSYILQEKRDLGFNIVPIGIRNGQTHMDIVSCGSSNDFNVVFGLETKIDEACARVLQLLEAPSITGGVYTVIANPTLAGTFAHEAFGHTSEGEKVYENKRLQEIMTLGKEFGSSVLNIYDTGLVEGSRGAIVYDDEGVAAEKTDLIVDGILTGRLHSRETAGKMGEHATGNARAVSYKYPPIPRMRITCIAGGATPFAEMIKDVKLGVYACEAFGGQGGEMFTFTAGRGYMIRDGHICEMVKDVTLSGNLFVTLKNIDRIGDDFQIHEAGGGCGKGEQFPLPVATGAPHIRIQQVTIGGR